jgi:uncharacterized protein (TIGR03437 family)
MRGVWIAIGYCSVALAAWGQTSTITAVLNSLSQPRMAPGDGVTVYGSFPSDVRSTFTAMFGSVQASLNFVVIDVKLGHATQIGLQVPTEISPGPTSVTVSHLGAAGPAFPVTVSQFDPAINTDPFSAFVHTSGVAVTPSTPAAPGETITTFMNGLGATTPLVPTGTGPSDFAPTSTAVKTSIGGMDSQAVFAGRYPTSPFPSLNYQVSFVVPANAPNGPNTVVVNIGGVSSNMQTLFVGTSALPAPPVVSSVVSGATFSTSTIASPGSFVSVFGTGFGSQDNLSAFPNTQVDGISVLFNGVPAPIFALAAAEGQINVLVPSETPTYGNVAVTVTNQNGPSKAAFLTVGAAGPGIFVVPDPSNKSRRNAAVLFNNTAWYVMPASQAQEYGFPACAGLSVTARCGQPAKRGDFIQVYATGLGLATPNGNPNGTSLATGQVAPANGNPIYQTVVTPTITVGGQTTSVAFSGLAPGFAGLYQVNFQIPQNAMTGDNVPIVISIPGGASDSATLAIQ